MKLKAMAILSLAVALSFAASACATKNMFATASTSESPRLKTAPESWKRLRGATRRR